MEKLSPKERMRREYQLNKERDYCYKRKLDQIEAIVDRLSILSTNDDFDQAIDRILDLFDKKLPDGQ